MKAAVLVLAIGVLAAVMAAGGSVYAQEAPRGEALAELISQKRAELDGTQWTIELTPMLGETKTDRRGRPIAPQPAEVKTDVVVFAEGKVISNGLSEAEFPPANYNVRVHEDETVTWETMHSLENGDLAFWRGDIGPDGVMRGVLSRRDAQGSVSNFDFVSRKK